MDSDIILRLQKNPDFVMFLQHLNDSINALDTVNDLENLSNEAAGQEAKVRLKAKVKLLGILKLIIQPEERRLPSEEDFRAAEKKAGIDG